MYQEEIQVGAGALGGRRPPGGGLRAEALGSLDADVSSDPLLHFWVAALPALSTACPCCPLEGWTPGGPSGVSGTSSAAAPFSQDILAGFLAYVETTEPWCH